MTLAPLLACSSCFLGFDGARSAYVLSTLLLLALPATMVSWTIRWLRRDEHASERRSIVRRAPLGLTAVGCVALLVFVMGHESANAGGRPAAPPTLTPFVLEDQHGAAFASDRLTNKVWVADFVFTSCPTLCPQLSTTMAELQRRVRDLRDVHLVSFSVDPERDTPAALRDYAARFCADPARWSFVRGSTTDLQATIEHGFRVAMGNAAGGTAPDGVVHSTRFVLVGRGLRIRGYFDVADPDGLAGLVRAVEAEHGN